MIRPAAPMERDPLALDRVPLSPATFDALRNLLHAHSGIALAHHKITMVQSRLAKRLRALGLRSYEQYHDLLRDCLLYTSPSPRDGLLSRMPSSA